MNITIIHEITHLIFTCSNSIIETLEKGVKWNVIDVVLIFSLLTLNTFSSVSVVDFEQVNISWDSISVN